MNKQILKTISAALLLAAFGATSAVADIVYVTACVSNCVSTLDCGNGPNMAINSQGNYVYLDEDTYGAYTSAKAGNTDKVTVPGARYHSNAFSNSTPDIGIVLSPDLGVPGGIYKLYHVYSSTANNVSTNVTVGFTNVSGCTISLPDTDKFQRKYGQPSPQSWQLLGFVTNDIGSANPRIRLYFVGGVVNANAQQRFMIEQFKFEYYDPCTDVPGVTVSGPLSTATNLVRVRAVTNATKITVWQDSGTGMVQIGTKTTDIVNGDNYVTVTGLVKGAKVAATQTVGGVDGCKPQDGLGVQVGGGANPKLRLALSLKENPTATGPAGANGGPGNNSQIFFVPCSTVSGDAPQGDSISITPGTAWQDVTVNLGRQGIASASNAVGAAAAVISPGYNYSANESVVLRVYAFKTVNGTQIFSATPAQSAAVTSNDVFIVNWTWDAVADAEGYRLLRDRNGGGYLEYADVTGATSFVDDTVTGWLGGNTVTPTKAQSTPSYIWFPISALTNMSTTWAVLEAIALVSDDASDNGPFNIYIDDLANGGTVFQDFEGFAAGTLAGAVFNQPNYSGTTSGYILATPDDATIVNEAAYSGARCQRVQWQFKSGALTEWMRFNTFNTTVMPNPLVNLDEDISFKILVLPVGATPVPPLQPATITSITPTAINYTGGTAGPSGKFVLLESADLNALRSTWTRAQTNTGTPGTFTIAPSGTPRFYSIKSE